LDARVNKFSADIARYKSKGHAGKALWLNPVIWAIAFYRLRNWVNVANPPWLIRIPLVGFCFVPNWFCEAFFSMAISPRASIGEGLYIGHIGGVIISPKAVIGRNCDISHRVTIGASAMGRDGAPVLGDNIYIGTGATLVGKIRIGSGAKIAANTLVIDDVPEGATMMGVPGRILLVPPSSVQSRTPPAAKSSDRP
jgi:serine O-acetyltransferase